MFFFPSGTTKELLSKSAHASVPITITSTLCSLAYFIIVSCADIVLSTISVCIFTLFLFESFLIGSNHFFLSFAYFFCYVYGDCAGDQPYKEGRCIAVKAIMRALSFLANPIVYFAAFIASLEPSIATRIFECLF